MLRAWSGGNRAVPYRTVYPTYTLHEFDIVSVKFEGNEWYQGEVWSREAAGWYIVFDDGEADVFDPSSDDCNAIVRVERLSKSPETVFR